MNKKHIFYFGFVLATLIGLQSCETPREPIVEIDENSENVGGAMKVAFRNIKSGYLTGNGEEGIEKGGTVINSQANWDAFSAKMNSVNKAIKEQSFDFNKQTVLVYFDQVRGSGGYSVDFATISKIKENIQAIVQTVDSDGNDIEIMTQPYAIVVIDKTEDNVVFVEQ